MAYAFWGYDLYPFVLGGLVTRDFPDGTVEIEGYGVGSRFKPKHIILNDELGKETLRQLKQLGYDYCEAKRVVTVA